MEKYNYNARLKKIMDNFDRAQRDYENPPDEEEAEICEFCGEELVYLSGYMKLTLGCANQYCPSEFDRLKYGSVVINMAEHLAEVEQELRDLKLKYQQLKNVTLMQRSLTRSQQGE